MTDNQEPPQVQDYDLIRPIGEGGFGRVWLAANQTTGRLRAVKLIPLRRSGATDAAGREIVSLTRLEVNLGHRHQNLLSIHHVGKTADYLFYVMDLADDISGRPASDFCEGLFSQKSIEADADVNVPHPSPLPYPSPHPNPLPKGEGIYRNYLPATLRKRLESGPLDPKECFTCARQLTAGLASLHQAGMVHRDVKPANCLFVGGELKLADFSLLTEASPLVSRAGTEKYMPPDGRMDARADVYAAGLVIYEMVTGLPADRFPGLGELGRRVVDDPFLSVLIRVALRACEGDPQRRYRDAREMLQELKEPDPRTALRRKRVKWLISACLTCIAALLLIWTGAWPSRPPLVHVNFTYPFEATIYLDNILQVDAEGHPYRTPCTIEGLQARTYHVMLKHDELGELDAGLKDFSKDRRIGK
ncbi:MAG: serine/threonine-protein kinase [Thermoguttaceae bacterium]|jgi:serine/threonine protein kinase